MITAHLNSLTEKGYITKEQSQEDKRVYYILPTEKALELVERAKEDIGRHLDYLVEGMGEDAFDNLVRLAKKANQAFEADRKKTQEA